MVIEPSRTWLTNSVTRFLPRSRDALSTPNRPCSTIWSRRLPSCVSTEAAAACGFATASAIGISFADFTLQLVKFLSVAHGFEKQLFQLVVTLQGAAKIRKPGAQIEEFLEGLDLLGHVGRFKVIKLAEFEIDLQIRRFRIVAEFVLHSEGEVWLHSLENRVKIIRNYLD